jgi:choline kinase
MRNVTYIHAPPKRELSVIILGAGPGDRMKSYGPRPLIRLTPAQTILSRQLDIIGRMLHPKEIILVSGYEARKIMDNTPQWIINIENEKFDTTNITRSLGIGLRAATTENIIVIYGDLVFNDIALEQLPMDRSMVLIDESTMKDSEVGCNIIDNKLENIFYGLPNKWAQITFFKGKELKLLKSICWNPDKYNFYGFETLNEIIDKNGSFISYKPKGLKIVDVDNPKDIELAKNII